MNSGFPYNLITIILIFVTLFTGCNNTPPSSTSVSPVPGGGIYYKLPLIPLKITYDIINNSLSVSISEEVQTPIGTFGITAGETFIKKRFPGVRTLTILTGNKKYVYRLEPGHPYSIMLPSDENGKSQVIYSGTDDNLSIVIPNPTNETVANLKAQLQQEQEARARAEAQLNSQPSPQGQTVATGNIPIPTPSPTPTPRQELTQEQCQELIDRYASGKFVYFPIECQDMFQSYQRYAQQQEYQARQRRQQEEYQQQRQAEAARRRAEASERTKQRIIQEAGNTIDKLIRRRRP